MSGGDTPPPNNHGAAMPDKYPSPLWGATDQDRLHVLIVEDNEVDALLLQKRLDADAPNRFSFRQAATLAEARTVLGLPAESGDDCPFDLIILDYYLPDGEGPALAREVAAAPFVCPILMVSGVESGEPKDLQDLLREEVVARVIRKDWASSPGTLVMAVWAVLFVRQHLDTDPGKLAREMQMMRRSQRRLETALAAGASATEAVLKPVDPPALVAVGATSEGAADVTLLDRWGGAYKRNREAVIVTMISAGLLLAIAGVLGVEAVLKLLKHLGG